MRICIMCDSLAAGKGGAERVAARLCNELADEGHEVWVAYKETGRPPAYTIDAAVGQIPYSVGKGWEVRLRKVLEELELDICQIFYFNRRLFKYLRSCPKDVSITLQECTTPDRIIRNWRVGTKLSETGARWEREIALSCASRIRFTRHEFVDSVPSDIQAKVSVFFNSYERHNLVANVGIPGGDGLYRVIFIGGMKANKNLLFFLEAFSQLKELHDRWVIDVFGTIPSSWQGGYADKVMDFIEERALDDNVFFH